MANTKLLDHRRQAQSGRRGKRGRRREKEGAIVHTATYRIYQAVCTHLRIGGSDMHRMAVSPDMLSDLEHLLLRQFWSFRDSSEQARADDCVQSEENSDAAKQLASAPRLQGRQQAPSPRQTNKRYSHHLTTQVLIIAAKVKCTACPQRSPSLGPASITSVIVLIGRLFPILAIRHKQFVQTHRKRVL